MERIYEVLQIYRRRMLYINYNDKLLDLGGKINILLLPQTTPLDRLICLSNTWNKISSEEKQILLVQLVGIRYAAELYSILSNENNYMENLIELKNLTKDNFYQFFIEADKDLWNLYKIFQDDLSFDIPYEQQEYLDFLYKIVS